MTVPLSPGSSRGMAARRFGAELKKAMAARHVGVIRLSEATGCAKSAIAAWKIGQNLPRVETAARLAEALDWPRLTDLARTGRTLSCARCGREFVNAGGSPARYCSPDCRDVDAQLRRPTAGVELAAAIRAELDRKARVRGGIQKAPLEEALARYARHEARRVQRVDKMAQQMAAVRGAIDDMCRTCEPAGVCRAPECPLRGVSPLPLAGRESDVIRPVEGPHHPANRDRWLASVRAGNAERWSRPGERERQSERTTHRFAAMSDEERAAWRRRVSQARRRNVA